MDAEQHRERAANLYAVIAGSTDSAAWSTEAGGASSPPQWQRDVISRILALTFDQEILYLSTAMPDGEDWDIVAFTDASVVRVLVVRVGDHVSHTESVAFPRSSLESLELLGVAPVPDDEVVWPSDLNLIGHYRAATINLPLDKFASRDNKKELVRLLTSLLQDLAH